MKHKKISFIKRFFILVKNDPSANAVIISLICLFVSLSFIGSGVHIKYTNSEMPYKEKIIAGVILLVNCPLSLLDERIEMRSPFATTLYCVMFLAVSIYLSYTDTPIWIVCFPVGILICVAVMFLIIHSRDRKASRKKDSKK